jgi:hypothetical protein
VSDHHDDFVVDDDDLQECRYMSRAELYEVHVDNPVDAHLAGDVLTLTYSSGQQWQVGLADIALEDGAAAVRYRKTGGLAFPTDGWSVLLNGTTVPRLAALRRSAETGDPPDLSDVLATTAGALDR